LTFGSYVDPSIFGDYSIPLIASQPTNQTVTIASNVTFTVSAFGAGPLYYQWYFNNIAVSGATSAGYSLTNAMATNAGSYTVIITNYSGSVTSSVAALTVSKVLATVHREPDLQRFLQRSHQRGQLLGDRHNQ
jgi:lactate dehydrogenase-like 2-hydroxyacid dehydrogenase